MCYLVRGGGTPQGGAVRRPVERHQRAVAQPCGVCVRYLQGGSVCVTWCVAVAPRKEAPSVAQSSDTSGPLRSPSHRASRAMCACGWAPEHCTPPSTHRSHSQEALASLSEI
jgi:hypothetical protein